MKLYAVLFSLPALCAATTLATADAYCAATEQSQASQETASANCAGSGYSSWAAANAFTVKASAWASPSVFGLTTSGSVASFHGDYVLTMLGATGSGYLGPNFSYQILTSSGTSDESASLIGTVNGHEMFYVQNDLRLPCLSGAWIPFTFGEPVAIRVDILAIVSPSGYGGAHSVSAQLTLGGFTGMAGDCSSSRPGCITSSQFSMIEAPEPSLILPIIAALVVVILRRKIGE